MSDSPPLTTNAMPAQVAGAAAGAKLKDLPRVLVGRPPFRPLRAYAFDPSLSQELKHTGINSVTLKVPWEYDPETGKDVLKPGPIGEYLEVIDVDPASDCFYAPVDLDEPYLLAQDGLAPAEANPQFHQQMVYAVAMMTIKNFEHALGRRALWAPQKREDGALGSSAPPPAAATAASPKPADASESAGQAVLRRPDLYAYVPRLRVYPHALREANAYYSPDKKALLFGYFPAPVDDVRFHLPGGMVFCCLSHDVVAHETTHALLDGLHRRFIEPTNPDVLAFHEGFADIVALFQHFSFPEVLRSQVARTRGDLATENLLGQLAQEFGNATGLHGALRDALGQKDPVTNTWEPMQPDPLRMRTEMEPHARGSLLVAAVFRAFVSIYKARSADLLRIATSGTGVLPQGELHPDLVHRLAAEAAKSAQHVLSMCIRALDYCPPVDMTFGNYLRALITADYDLVRDDDLGYRVAVVEAFRQYGIYPRDVRSLSSDTLRWAPPLTQGGKSITMPAIGEMRAMVEKRGYTANREKIQQQEAIAARILHNALQGPGLDLEALGLDVKHLMRPDGRPAFEVHSVRPARRVGPDGQLLTDLVIEITQWKPGYYDSTLQQRADNGETVEPYDFKFRGGSTLLVDLHSGEVRYCVAKYVQSATRLARQRDFRLGRTDASLRAMYFGALQQQAIEPFAFLHRETGKGQTGEEKRRS